MQMAIDVANFTPGEADQLRQAMGSKRSHQRMARLRGRLMEGMAANGITGEVADEVAHKLEAFADFGFPESHSVSFAYLVYSSSWMKLHYPAEFASRVAQRAADGLLLAAHPGARRDPPRCRGARSRRQRIAQALHARIAHRGRRPDRAPTYRVARDPSIHAVRIGLRYVRGLTRTRCSTGSTTSGCSTRSAASKTSFAVPARRSTRSSRSRPQARSAASTRPAAARCWAAGALHEARPRRHLDVESHTLPGLVTGIEAPPLPGLSAVEETAFDLPRDRPVARAASRPSSCATS